MNKEITGQIAVNKQRKVRALSIWRETENEVNAKWYLTSMRLFETARNKSCSFDNSLIWTVTYFFVCLFARGRSVL